MRIKLVRLVFALLVSVVASCAQTTGKIPDSSGKKKSTSVPEKVRLGYFANLTHAQALIGVTRGDFQRVLGDVPLDTKVFNAGPAVVEAFFAGELDLAYCGPSPAILTYVKSHGKAVRIVAGSAANGVVIVARKHSGIAKLEDLNGQRIATPQFGNSQDISARVYVLKTLGAALKEKNGDTEIQTIANAEQLGLFRAGQLDAAWVPEPWGARLIHEAGAVLLAEEKDMWPGRRFCSTVVLASTKFIEEYPETVKTFLAEHARLTEWVNANPAAAAAQINAELRRLAGKALPAAVLQDALARIEFTTDPLRSSVEEFAARAEFLGMLKGSMSLEGLFAMPTGTKIVGAP